MATSGENQWPPAGNFLAVVGEKLMAIDTPLRRTPPGQQRGQPPSSSREQIRAPPRFVWVNSPRTMSAATVRRFACSADATLVYRTHGSSAASPSLRFGRVAELPGPAFAGRTYRSASRDNDTMRTGQRCGS